VRSLVGTGTGERPHASNADMIGVVYTVDSKCIQFECRDLTGNTGTGNDLTTSAVIPSACKFRSNGRKQIKCLIMYSTIVALLDLLAECMYGGSTNVEGNSTLLSLTALRQIWREGSAMRAREASNLFCKKPKHEG